MRITSDFTFTRKYFIKDLLKAETLIKDAGVLEFASFMDFAQTYLRDKKFSLETVDKLIVPAENGDEASLLLRIDPNVRPYLIIYLKDFSKETRDEFHEMANASVLCDADRVAELKKAMLEDPSPNFVEFISRSYGYFRNHISCNNVDKIPYIYSDAFFTLPYFCIADIRWDWASFEDMKLKDLHAIVYNTSMVSSNLPKQLRELDLSTFGGEGKSSWAYDYMHTPNAKRLFIQDGVLYLDDVESSIGIDLYDERFEDANNIDHVEVDKLRSAFDVKFTTSWGVGDPSLISIPQNIKCTGNPAMVPYLCSIVSRTLNGGRV